MAKVVEKAYRRREVALYHTLMIRLYHHLAPDDVSKGKFATWYSATRMTASSVKKAKSPTAARRNVHGRRKRKNLFSFEETFDEPDWPLVNAIVATRRGREKGEIREGREEQQQQERQQRQEKKQEESRRSKKKQG